MRNYLALGGVEEMIAWVLLYPFFWFYDKIKWRYFRPEPMALYAIMIGQIDRANEYMRLMTEKGFHFQAIEVKEK